MKITVPDSLADLSVQQYKLLAEIKFEENSTEWLIESIGIMCNLTKEQTDQLTLPEVERIAIIVSKLNNEDENNYLAKKGKKRLMQAVVMMAFGLPPPAIFTKQDLLDKDLIKGVFSLTKANNAYKKSLEETIEGYNKLGMTQYHHAVDTPLQTKEQEYLDFTQKYDTDETDSGPRAIEVLPVGDESSPVEEMEVGYDWLGAIRDKQQKN